MIDDEKLRNFLEIALGLTETEINRSTLDTWLVQDLRRDGDDFLDAMESLHTEFGVDMSGFDYRLYCHSEAELLFPLATIRFLRRVIWGHEDRKYVPVTLGMIKQAIDAKQWLV
jgi:hypothetical protein